RTSRRRLRSRCPMVDITLRVMNARHAKRDDYGSTWVPCAPDRQPRRPYGRVGRRRKREGLARLLLHLWSGEPETEVQDVSLQLLRTGSQVPEADNTFAWKEPC